MRAQLHFVRGWFSQSGFRRDAAVLFTSTALARGLLLITMPLVARHFVPEDVGNWQLFVSIGTVLGTIVCLRYEVAIPLPAEEQKARDLVGTGTLVAGVVALLLALVMLTLRGLFIEWIASPALVPYLWYLPAMALLIGCEQTATYWLTRTGDFTSQGISRLLKSGFSVALPLALAIALHAQLSYLIVGTLLGQLAATAFMLRRDMWQADTWSFNAAKRARMWAVMREYKNYPLYVAPYAFVGQFAKRLVFFLLAKYAGASVVGYFAMAMQVTFVPITFITGALNQAFYRRASLREDIRDLQPLVFKVLYLQVIAAVPAFTLLVLHADYVMRVVLGRNWGETSAYVAWLAPASLSTFLTSWLDRMLDKLGEQRLAVIMQLIYDASSLLLLMYLLATKHSTVLSVAAYCGMTTLYSFSWLVVAFSRAGYSMGRLGRLALLAIALAGIVLAVHMPAAKLLAQPFGLIAETACAGVLALAALKLTRKSWA
ncbi:MAG TPA: lipopolysaccharide biosynthesis protein [Polyangiaceae bacterium]|nr:lipopolysaccharide biosynthesis protein [Polyangiaceae bacterium]